MTLFDVEHELNPNRSLLTIAPITLPSPKALVIIDGVAKPTAKTVMENAVRLKDNLPQRPVCPFNVAKQDDQDPAVQMPFGG